MLADRFEERGVSVYSPRSDELCHRGEVRLMIGILLLLFPQYVEKLEWGESVEPWPTLKVSGVLPGEDAGPVTKFAWGRRRDPETGKTEKDFTRLVYNSRVTVSNIPESAQGYVVNGRSPLDWVIDRYQVKTDRATSIVNDSNTYSC